MLDILARLRRGASADRRRAVRPVLEPLEGRLLLYSTTGDMFSDGRRITWSLVPDGTPLPGGPSKLFATMDAKFPRSEWVGFIEDAFAEWEKVANVNFSTVGDNGAPDGSGNIQQGSTSFGDIRIGAFPEGPTLAATTLLPPKANGGSNSGDIFLNSDVNWQLTSNSGVDLETIVLHEIGHSLGLGHSSDTSAAMFANYSGVREVPTADDIAGVRSIWGPRQEDAIARQSGNFAEDTAANITPYIQASPHQVLINPLDIANPGESYWFRFTTPPDVSGNMTVTMQSTWLSELSPWIQLYSGNSTLIGESYAPTFYFGATSSASIANMTPSTTYYVRTAGSNSIETGTGNYALLINMGDRPQAPAAPPGVLVYAQPDQGGGSSPEKFGGADGPGTKPDLPDLIATGGTVARGDNHVLAPATAPVLAPASVAPIRSINVPHPTIGLRGHRPPQANEPAKKVG